MPQLMPLMWVMSVIMSLLILFMLVDLYYYSEDLKFLNINFNENSNKVIFMW